MNGLLRDMRSLLIHHELDATLRAGRCWVTAYLKFDISPLAPFNDEYELAALVKDRLEKTNRNRQTIQFPNCERSLGAQYLSFLKQTEAPRPN